MTITIFYDRLFSDGSYMDSSHVSFVFGFWNMCRLCEVLAQVYKMNTQKIKVTKIIIHR